MIQHEGLMAVVTVYPIAILLLAVEVRGMEPFLATSKGARRQLIAGGIVSFLVVLLAVSAVNESVRLLLFGTEITLYTEIVIVAGGAGLGIVVPLALMMLMFDRVGIWAALSQRAAANNFDKMSTRERLDWFDRIERFNPSAPGLGPRTRASMEERAGEEEAAEKDRREREARRFGDSDVDPTDDV